MSVLIGVLKVDYGGKGGVGYLRQFRNSVSDECRRLEIVSIFAEVRTRTGLHFHLRPR